jgi:hypothetical protein
VDASNSLVGSNPDDLVGGVTALRNGNYVVISPQWSGGFPNGLGAVTWGDGTVGVTGPVSASNSLVGSHSGDHVGSGRASVGGVTALSNGNYVVQSPFWNGGFSSGLGAATWGDGEAGITGVVDVTNSLVGSTAGDHVGFDVTALSNGNYVVASPGWNDNRGAATWGDGTAGITGVVDPATNSLVGFGSNDQISSGGVTALSNGNYVVANPRWNDTRGAATWGDGTAGIIGIVTIRNSLIGLNPGDQVGGGGGLANPGGVTILSNGNYVVRSPDWNGQRGAVTWGEGVYGSTVGPVDDTNSLVG